MFRVAALVLMVASVGCGDSSTVFGGQCLMDSECDGSLVCRFGYCRPRCANDKDCADILGSRCVTDQDEGVCIVPDQEDCVRGLPCPGELSCVDLACRVACANPNDCLAAQSCSGGFCRQACTTDGDCIDADQCVLDICQPRVFTPFDGSTLDAGDAGSDICVAQPESCDGRDEDCDGRIDEDTDVAGFADVDRDGHGDPSAPVRGCVSSPELSLVADDCDDEDPNVHGGQSEICDSKDNDCDARIDEAAAATTWFADNDGDGFGSAASGMVSACEPPAGHSLLDSDCDDVDPMRNPGTEERCDGQDNDCNGLPDFAVGRGDHEDDDNDGFADAACGGNDCDDTNPSVFPGANELMDGIDNDCDGSTPDECSPIGWFPDEDGDGFGAGVARSSCTPVAGHAPRAEDCDDANQNVHPGAHERCDGDDDDCDDELDEAAHASCAAPHSIATCVSGACSLSICERGWDDCDTAAITGCEAQIASDPSACGGCGTVCATGEDAVPLCVAGSCDLMCNADRGDCNADPIDGCETDLRANLTHCGICNRACDMRPNTTTMCALGECTADCDLGFSDCNGMPNDGCEVETARSITDCGMCGDPCPVTDGACVAGACITPPFDCSGATVAFEPASGVVELPPGVHAFTSIHIPAGVTLVTSGNAVLELCSQGDVIIEGTIDLSGAPGGIVAAAIAGGGDTGNPRGTPLGGTSDQCHPAGGGGSGAVGSAAAMLMPCVPGLTPNHGLGGAFGGGAGSRGRFYPGAGGGGGYAGGGGGGGVNGHGGGAGASFMSDVGGAGGTTGMMICEPGGGGVAPGAYAGANGEMGSADCDLHGGGGGGGSIGATAADDLTVATTFRPGSSGGGGGGGSGFAGQSGGGGGGGGGALRISSSTRIVIRETGNIRADGGVGGAGGSSTTLGTGGGGGSGGVVYLAAPEVNNLGLVSAAGGAGGLGGVQGGEGGLGRIRLSVVECALSGTFNPPLAGLLCEPTAPDATAERVYVGGYPN